MHGQSFQVRTFEYVQFHPTKIAQSVAAAFGRALPTIHAARVVPRAEARTTMIRQRSTRT